MGFLCIEKDSAFTQENVLIFQINYTIKETKAGNQLQLHIYTTVYATTLD